MPWTAAQLVKAGDTGGYYNPTDWTRTFQDTAGTTPVTANNQAIARIDADAGAGSSPYNITQSNGSAQPKSSTTGFSVDGGDWMDSNVTSGWFATSGAPFTIGIAVGSWQAGSQCFFARCSATSANKTLQVYDSSGTLTVNCRGTTSTHGTLSGTASRVVIVRWDGTSFKLWLNGGSASTVTVGTAAQETAEERQVFTRTSGALLPTTGTNLGRFFDIDRALSDAEIENLKWDLGNSVGLTIGTEPTGIEATPAAGAVSVAGLAPTVSVVGTISATPAVGNIDAQGLAPAVSVAGAVAATPTAGQVSVAGLSAAVTIGGSISVNPATGDVSLSGLAPDVVVALRVDAGLGAVAASGLTPSVTVDAGSSIAVTPQAGAVSVVGLPAEIQFGAGVVAIASIGRIVVSPLPSIVSLGGPWSAANDQAEAWTPISDDAGAWQSMIETPEAWLDAV